MARLGMLIDLTRCIGCDACTVACKQENGTPADVFFARVLNIEAGAFPDVKRVYLPVLCNHCENPACLKACPNKAIFKREDGIVLIDQDRCRGTGACVSACPYGNIILKPEDAWYLPEDRPYETENVKLRLKQGAARKCTLCAHRVDDGLEPACAVACPTQARIFGDLEDSESKISLYVREQEAKTGRSPFHLLPDAGTNPTTAYLAPMAAQASVPVADGDATERQTQVSRPRELARVAGFLAAVLALALIVMRAAFASAPAGAETPEVWSNSSCAGCHGAAGMGGLGPPLAGTKVSAAEFHKIVREGRGMMPASPAAEMPDAEVDAVYEYARATPLDPTQIPFSYKVSSRLTVQNLGLAFGLISLVSALLALKVLAYWLRLAGVARLMPSVRKFGPGRAARVAFSSLIVDGLLVGSLWRASKGRWAMHGLMIYGFLALALADMLLGIFYPARSGLPISHPIKVLANVGGLSILLGILYVRIRYAKDEYIDNGLTLGRDYAFLNLLAWTVLTGFFVEGLGYAGASAWLLPVYMLHLGFVSALFLSAPFTRFAHAFVTPALVAVTRVTEAMILAGVDPGFRDEPAPGRDHKSQRLAEDLIHSISPEHSGKVRLRYFP